MYLHLNRKQEDRKERQGHKSGGLLPLSIPEEVDPPQTEDFKIDEYKDMMKGSFDTGDPLTTNLYVGNINPKVRVYVHMCIMGGSRIVLRVPVNPPPPPALH